MNNGCKFAYIEIPVSDFDKAKDFYGNIFEWTFDTNEGMDNYISFHAGDGPSGGFWIPKEDEPAAITNYIHVENIENIVKKLKDENCSIHVDKTSIGQYGWIAIFEDPFGNVFGLWQAK